MICRQIIVFCLALVLAACSQNPSRDDEKPVATLLPGLGTHHYPITTTHPDAQRFFDQGLILAYAFNHAEAAKAFREAARLDPRCAMCYWGHALVLGPNINAAMQDGAVAEAYAAARTALSLADRATEKERRYIAALQKRYTPEPVKDRSALDEAYAHAMRDVVKHYPGDADASTLYAEALMDLHPWDYWGKDGQPKPWTPEIVTTLERALKMAPDHPGANHFYIHAMEASPTPEKALPSADRLATLAPGAGHLVHMPAHIYIRTGRYRQAAQVNEQAVAVDRDYLHSHHSEGIYPMAYVPHNHHFLWAAASFAGRGEMSIEAAKATADHVDKTAMRQPGMATLEHYYAMPLYALARFGRWRSILEQPAPDPDLRYATAVWHYVRGLAYAATGKFSAATNELDALNRIAEEDKIAGMSIWSLNTVKQLLAIAAADLSGQIAAQRGDTAKAVVELQNAVRLEDGLRYTEPSDWYYPTRQSLGAVLLAAGQAKRAEAVYREDLTINPENGWSLFGLMQSLSAQGRHREAGEIRQRFENAWADADIRLGSSRIFDAVP